MMIHCQRARLYFIFFVLQKDFGKAKKNFKKEENMKKEKKP